MWNQVYTLVPYSFRRLWVSHTCSLRSQIFVVFFFNFSSLPISHPKFPPLHLICIFPGRWDKVFVICSEKLGWRNLPISSFEVRENCNHSSFKFLKKFKINSSRILITILNHYNDSLIRVQLIRVSGNIFTYYPKMYLFTPPLPTPWLVECDSPSLKLFAL